MHGYISRDSLEKLVRDDRVSFVISDVDTLDIDEYINASINLLGSLGFNTNLLTKCNIFKTNGLYNIVVTIRSAAKPQEINREALELWMIQMGNIKTAQQYLRDSYNIKDSQPKKSIKIKCLCRGSNKKRFTANMDVRLTGSGDIRAARTTCNKQTFIIVPNKENVNDIPNLVLQLYSRLWKQDKSVVDQAVVMIDNIKYTYNVVNTNTGIRLQKI